MNPVANTEERGKTSVANTAPNVKGLYTWKKPKFRQSLGRETIVFNKFRGSQANSSPRIDVNPDYKAR